MYHFLDELAHSFFFFSGPSSALDRSNVQMGGTMVLRGSFVAVGRCTSIKRFSFEDYLLYTVPPLFCCDPPSSVPHQLKRPPASSFSHLSFLSNSHCPAYTYYSFGVIKTAGYYVQMASVRAHVRDFFRRLYGRPSSAAARHNP
jgi:hypothetical protein